MVRYLPKDILVEFLRAKLTDPRGRHTATSDTFTADGSTTQFTLTPSSGTKVQAVTSVTVSGSSQNKWRDYYVDLQNQQINFASAPTSGSIVVNYKEGSTSWIYSDEVRNDMSSTSFPRISVAVVTSPGERVGNYQAAVEYNLHFQVNIWTKEGQYYTINSISYEGDRLAQILGYLITEALEENESSLHHKLYDYQPITGPRDLPFDQEHQAFHSIVEFALKTIDAGENI